MADAEEMETEHQSSSSESDEEMEEETQEQIEEQENDDRPNVYLPGQPLKEDEELICDQSAYVMLHQAQSGAPCLSFDVIQDNLGENRDSYPLTAYIVAGTQAARTHANNVIIMKMSNLNKTGEDDDDEDEDAELSDDDEESKPVMYSAMIKHLGCINRIRSTVVNSTHLVASWSELGRVNIFDVSKQLELLEKPADLALYNKNNSGNSVMPIYTFTGHQKEGFGIDWSRTAPGVSITHVYKSFVT